MTGAEFVLFILAPLVFLGLYGLFQCWYKGYGSVGKWWRSEIDRRPRRKR